MAVLIVQTQRNDRVVQPDSSCTGHGRIRTISCRHCELSLSIACDLSRPGLPLCSTRSHAVDRYLRNRQISHHLIEHGPHHICQIRRVPSIRCSRHSRPPPRRRGIPRSLSNAARRYPSRERSNLHHDLSRTFHDPLYPPMYIINPLASFCFSLYWLLGMGPLTGSLDGMHMLHRMSLRLRKSVRVSERECDNSGRPNPRSPNKFPGKRRETRERVPGGNCHFSGTPASRVFVFQNREGVDGHPDSEQLGTLL